MAKIGFISLFMVGLAFFTSCSNNGGMGESHTNMPEQPKPAAPSGKDSYGAYVAGRVAHLRHDFNNASNYYMQILEKNPDNPQLLQQVFLMLTMQERLDEAARYAKLSIQNGEKNPFVYVPLAVSNIHNGKYDEALKYSSKMKGEIYPLLITPLLNAWAYAGKQDAAQAIKALAPLKKEKLFNSLYYLHAGMINDYLGDSKAAAENYETILNNENMEMSLRTLEIICNFYLRQGQQAKALQLVQKYRANNQLLIILNPLSKQIAAVKGKESAAPIINSASIGLSDALYAIATLYRQNNNTLEMAHMYTAMSLYANPKNDLALLLLADIMETREMYKEANDVYNKIDKSSPIYNTIQLKRANNYIIMEDYNAAEILLKTLIIDNNVNDYKVYLNLGDVLRIKDNQKEAIKYYETAISKLPKIEKMHWVLFYALGISYERNSEWDKAEKSFKTALKLSGNNYLVLNYLGYSLIKQGNNIETAFSMIVDAYNQAPNDGHVTDSLGWALYRLGYYDNAVSYLEKAADLEPANALISEHLGDAYWFVNRQNEARFQWRHALTMKDDSGELIIKDVENKIKNGLQENPAPDFDAISITTKISEITAE